MRKIRNVFIQPSYHCFACRPDNPKGLQMEFFEEDGWIISDWNPTPEYEGYPGIVHGGIQATLLDEVGAWAVYIQAKTGGVTSRMNLKYKKGTSAKSSPLRLRARIKERKRNLCFIEAQLFDAQGNICTEAELHYYLLPVEKLIAEGLYPADYNDFFKE